MPPHDLRAIFKAYDVRGVVPDELDEDDARRIGASFAAWAQVGTIAVGYDCRLSSPSLAEAVREGIVSQGANVIDLGLASTDLLYFASGSLDVAGVMLTASHNPPRYNGMKFCLPGARPVGQESGLGDILAGASRELSSAAARGVVQRRELLDAYADHVLSFVDVETMPR